MTTTWAPTSTETKVCAQTFAGLASLGIVTHVAHELISGEPASAGEAAAVVVAAGAVVTLTLAWYRLGRTPRRVLAVVLGALWALAASGHAVATVTGGTALDVTGVLAVVGGLLLAFAAYWDFHRPLERSR